MGVTKAGTLSWGFGNSSNSATGFFVNRTEVLNYFGKCAYAHDGGTDYRFNFGCGCNDEGSPRCDSKAAAYYSLDPETNFQTNLTDKSPLVGGCTVEKLDAGQAQHTTDPLVSPRKMRCIVCCSTGLRWLTK